MLHDLRYSLRLLRRSPAFALTAAGTFALAIGISTAVFAVVDPILLRPLPIAEPSRVVVIWPREQANPTTIGEISHWTFRAWQGQTRSFDTLAAIGSVNWSLILRDGDEPATLPVAGVSASFFPLLGTPAARGRTLLPDDDRRGAAKVVVMSHGSWVRRFGADPDIVGRRLMLSGDAYTVVGVMPEAFDYPRGVELWMPVVPHLETAGAQYDLDALEERWFGVLFVLGRLADTATIDSARAELATLMARGVPDEFAPGWEPALTPLPEHIFGHTRPALLALAAGVGLIWLIACANVAALLLIRAVARSHESAVLAAIGASRWRLLRRGAVDALVLSSAGGAAGVLLAWWAVPGLVALAPPDVPRLESVTFDVRAVAFALIACLTAGVVAGTTSALYTARWNVAGVLNAGGSRLTRSHRARRGFVLAQVAMAVTLVVAAGLVMRSFANLLTLGLGFTPANVLTLDVLLPDATPERRAALYTALLERIDAMPGVDAAGAVFLRPLEHAGIGLDGTILIEGQRVDLQFRDWEKNPRVNYETVTPDYFRAIGIRVLRGRAFAAADDAQGPQVVIVSDALARRLWPGEDPIGRRVIRPGAPTDAQGQPTWSTVVGVVETARYRGLMDVRFDLYIPYLQRLDDPVKHVMVRTTADPLSLVPAIRAAARDLEPAVLVEGVRTMEQIVERAMSPWRFSATALGVLGALALVLATLGVYGIASQSVVERTREIAIRSTLGALPADIARLVLREGLSLTIAGIAAGLAAAAAGTRMLGGLLLDVRPLDPGTMAGTAALFALVSAVAMAMPLMRALRVDPALTLRRE